MALGPGFGGHEADGPGGLNGGLGRGRLLGLGRRWYLASEFLEDADGRLSDLGLVEDPGNGGVSEDAEGNLRALRILEQGLEGRVLEGL